MTDNPQFTDGDEDVQGHRYAPYADAETSEGGDVEGHRYWTAADTETPEGDDVEGHRYPDPGVEIFEGDDVGGHGHLPRPDHPKL